MGKITFLGTGSSTASPVIGCKCRTCKSTSKYNKRLRPSILIQKNRKNILVDVGPDIRHQAIKFNINKLDALIITHAHFDHMAGLDDLRIFNRMQNKPLKCYLLKETLKEIKKKYDYMFEVNIKGHTQSARFDFQVLNEKKLSFKVADIIFDGFTYFQDSKKVLGFRVDDFAFITDIKRYREKILDKLKDLDILILSSLREEPTPVHFNIEEAIEFANKIKPKMTYLTHLAHEIEHISMAKKLKKQKYSKNIKLAYDGLELKF